MKKSKLLIISALILTLGLFFKHPPVEESPQARNVKISLKNRERSLGLTHRQRQRLLLDQALFREDSAEIDGQINVKKIEMENEFVGESPDQTRLDRLCNEIGVLYGKKLKMKIFFQTELEKKILTPQQLVILEDWREEKVSPPIDTAFMK